MDEREGNIIAWLRADVGDASAASQLSEQEVEDPDNVLDLRSLTLRQKRKYDAIRDKVQKFLHAGRCRFGCVEEQKHSQVTHPARVSSVRNLLEQVAA